MISILLTTLAVVLVVMATLWIVSVVIVNASIVDLVWGPGFAFVAWTTLLLTPNHSPRSWLVCVLVTIWAIRLAVHLGARNIGHGEDYRYRTMRQAHGARFWWVSLGSVFLLQGVLMWIVSMPLQFAQAPDAIEPLGWLDIVGAVLWFVGIGFESVADAQLSRFRRSPSGKGGVMDRGLWRYSRHPNYFGEFVLWWGFGAFALSVGAWGALIGPLVMSVLLLKVSGVSLLESTIAERRPAYRDYAARTSAFVPWFPRAR